MARPKTSPRVGGDAAPRRGRGVWLWSVAFHVGLAAAVWSARAPVRGPETIAIAVVETEAKKKPAAAPPPPPPPAVPERAEPSRRTPRAAAPQATAPAEATPAAGADAPLLDLTMGGGAGGFAVAAPGPAPRAPAAAPAQSTRKSLGVEGPRPAGGDADCGEAPVKARPKAVPTPSYPVAAREAGVAGKVRVEVTVDASGRVSAARVVSGLGHGLDEAALAAARGATFEPASRCGRPVVGTVVIGVRFSL